MKSTTRPGSARWQVPDDEMLEDLRQFLPQGPAGAPYVEWLDQLITERRRIRQDVLRREHDLDTLFSIVRELSERTLDPRKLELYLLRTMMGRFLVWKVIIFRRSLVDDRLHVAAARGLGPHREKAEKGFSISRDSMFSELVAEQRGIVNLLTAETPFGLLPEVRMLKEIGIETIVPLLASERGGETSVEGFLALGPRLGGRSFRQSDLRFLEMLGGIIAVACRNELLFRRSILDDLTRVASRGHFDARVRSEIARCERYDGEGFALVMLDIDGFKGFNDRHGHQIGDIALRRVASVISSCVRSSDLVARYGGEEFAVILVEITSTADAVQIAERIRNAVRNRPAAEKGGKNLSLTMSLGVACYPQDAGTPQELVAAADASLYRAKALGRDRVCAAEPVRGDAVG